MFRPLPAVAPGPSPQEQLQLKLLLWAQEEAGEEEMVVWLELIDILVWLVAVAPGSHGYSELLT